MKQRHILSTYAEDSGNLYVQQIQEDSTLGTFSRETSDPDELVMANLQNVCLVHNSKDGKQTLLTATIENSDPDEFIVPKHDLTTSELTESVENSDPDEFLLY